MSYKVIVCDSAREDMQYLFDDLLAGELAREGDPDYPDHAIDTLVARIRLLEESPFSCRKNRDSTFLRELVMPFGDTGYVALFEIVSSDRVVISAIRLLREDDYH